MENCRADYFMRRFMHGQELSWDMLGARGEGSLAGVAQWARLPQSAHRSPAQRHRSLEIFHRSPTAHRVFVWEALILAAALP